MRHFRTRARSKLNCKLPLRAQGIARYEDADLVVLETDGFFTAVRRLGEVPNAATESLTGLERQARSRGT